MKTYGILVLVSLSAVSSVKITKSIYPSPTFQIDKPPTLIWTVAYNENEKIKTTLLFLDGIAKEIASDGKSLYEEGKRKLNGTASVTITKEKITVNFLKLEYWYDFNFTCMAAGVPIEGEKDVKYSHIQVTNITGRPLFVGNSELKDQYIIENGTLSFEVKLTGHPCPILTYTFVGKTQEAEKVVIDLKQRIYKYTVKLSDVRPEHCGEAIKFKIIGSEIFEKVSFVHVKYKPLKINGFEFVKRVRENCTMFKVPNHTKDNCPINYKVTIYNAMKKMIPGSIRFPNPVTFSGDKKEYCDRYTYKEGEFATIQVIWGKGRNAIPGEESEYVKSMKENEFIYASDAREETPKNGMIIGLTLGVCLSILLFLILLKYIRTRSQKQRIEIQEDREPAPDNHYVKYIEAKSKTTAVGDATALQYSQLERTAHNQVPSQRQPRVHNALPPVPERAIPTYSRHGPCPNPTPSLPSKEEMKIQIQGDYQRIYVQEPQDEDPMQQNNSEAVNVYSELGEGGGRLGPKPDIKSSNYADAKELERHSYNSQTPLISSESEDDFEELPILKYPRQKEEFIEGYSEVFKPSNGPPIYKDPRYDLRQNPPDLYHLQRDSEPGVPAPPSIMVPVFDNKKE